MRYYTDSDYLKLDGKRLPYTMVDFWRDALSVILLNMTRGSFAEFVVKCCMQESGFNALSQLKNGTELWDIDGPDITMPEGVRPSRIEVKCTASIQLDTPPEQEPISLPDSKLRFGTKRASNPNSKDPTPHHNNDLYVFCHYKGKTKDDDMFDLSLWDFYVMPTYMIREDSSLCEATGVSLYKVKKLGISVHSFQTLYAEIIRVLQDVSSHYMQ